MTVENLFEELIDSVQKHSAIFESGDVNGPINYPYAFGMLTSILRIDLMEMKLTKNQKKVIEERIKMLLQTIKDTNG